MTSLTEGKDQELCSVEIFRESRDMRREDRMPRSFWLNMFFFGQMFVSVRHGSGLIRLAPDINPLNLMPRCTKTQPNTHNHFCTYKCASHYIRTTDKRHRQPTVRNLRTPRPSERPSLQPRDFQYPPSEIFITWSTQL